MRRLLAALILLSGCMASPASETIILPPDPPPIQAAPRLPPKPTVAMAPPTDAKQIIAASEQARSDATGYVAWKHSKAENIDKLTVLTSSLNLAIARLRSERGRYTQADVNTARSALQDLRSFLTAKGD